jgi:beta-alanine degradation protein BauB
MTIDSSNELTPQEAQRRRWLALLPGLALASAVEAQDAAQVQPQAYRVGLDNDQMRVLDFVSRPGMGVCGSGVHSHPPHLTVALSDCRVHVRENGKDFIAENKLGDVFWSPAVTHETENVSGRDVRALIVELKPSPLAKG